MTIRDWLVKWFGSAFKKAVKTVPVLPDIVVPPVEDKPVAVTADLSSPLVDPPPPYTQAWMDINGGREECGIEAQQKIIVRVMAIRGESGGYWMVTSLVGKRVKKTATGNELQDWQENGYSFHVRGSVSFEPQQNQIVSLVPEVKGNTGLQKYIILEIRKEK